MNTKFEKENLFVGMTGYIQDMNAWFEIKGISSKGTINVFLPKSGITIYYNVGLLMEDIKLPGESSVIIPEFLRRVIKVGTKFWRFSHFSEKWKKHTVCKINLDTSLIHTDDGVFSSSTVQGACLIIPEGIFEAKCKHEFIQLFSSISCKHCGIKKGEEND